MAISHPGRYKREISAAIAFAAFLLLVGSRAPSFFSAGNLRDLALNNAPVLLVATGMTMVILVGEIDISVGSQFAVCTVGAGLLVHAGVPVILMAPCVIVVGAFLGSINGLLVGRLGLPSIIVTLAMLTAWRDALRWGTQGAWVQDLPQNFQWFGLSQTAGQWTIVSLAVAILIGFSWVLRNLTAGRAIYAVGSDKEAARLAGIEPPKVITGVFVLMGALTGLAAALNAVRFSVVPSNAGIGLELQAVAAVVVGGTAITGGRGTMIGTLIGTALLGAISTGLTFIGVNPFWAKAIQGAIILLALVSDVVLGRLENHGKFNIAGAAGR